MDFKSIYSGRRVFMTGHTGFKGSWLCEWLLRLGAEVYGFSNGIPTKPSLFAQLRLTWRITADLRGDVRDRAAVRAAIEATRPDFVFHLAAQPLVRQSYAEPVETFDTNVMGTVHVLDALRSLKGRCSAVMVTTDKCYENKETARPYREDDPMGGYDPYSCSKGCDELAISSYRRSFFGDPSSNVCVASADIVQTFHWMDYHSSENPFGVALAKVVHANCKFVRMYESDVQFVANADRRYSINDILSDPTPRMVIPHYPERTFRDAYIAPNIIPIHDPLLAPPSEKGDSGAVDVFYSASSKTSMWEQRWNTKGAPEVLKVLNEARRVADFKINYVVDTPYEKCMEMKRQSDIVIGDTTSGSFHLTDFEALSQGRPTFTYADPRSIQVLMALLGCPELPFVNARIEELQAPLVELVKDKSLRREIGAYSRDWVEKYYRDDKLVEFYVRAYEQLLNGGDLKRQDHLCFSRAKTFLYNDLYDLQWETRKQNPVIKPEPDRAVRRQESLVRRALRKAKNLVRKMLGRDSGNK